MPRNGVKAPTSIACVVQPVNDLISLLFLRIDPDITGTCRTLNGAT